MISRNIFRIDYLLFHNIRSFFNNNRYAGKVTGNSSKVSVVGTDNDAFLDFGVSIRFHVGLSFLYEIGDQRRFSLGTVRDIASTMKRFSSV